MRSWRTSWLSAGLLLATVLVILGPAALLWAADPALPVDPAAAPGLKMLAASLINTAGVLTLVAIGNYYLPAVRATVPWLIPIATTLLGPVVALGQTWLAGQLGVPIDLSPLLGVFTGAAAVMVHQTGKQATS